MLFVYLWSPREKCRSAKLFEILRVRYLVFVKAKRHKLSKTSFTGNEQKAVDVETRVVSALKI